MMVFVASNEAVEKFENRIAPQPLFDFLKIESPFGLFSHPLFILCSG